MTDRSHPAKPLAVQFGAGNIGRGFMGELFSAGGYHTRFVEVAPDLVAALRRRDTYTIHHITNDGDEPVTVTDVSVVDGRDTDAVADALARADLACTAVGVRAMEAIAPALARGCARRMDRADAPPLNIITCENMVGAGRHLGNLVWDEIARAGPTADRGAFDRAFGFVEAVVSRMVPIVPDEKRTEDPLWIACEPYARLPVDGAAIVGDPPEVPGLEPVDDIRAYQRRKLACHNMSHATCAYLGYQAGHEMIWQAMDDPDVFGVVRAALDETGRALISRFGFDPERQRAHEADLLERYRNRALGDQVRRVGADPLRKLGPDDRLIGSARLCLDEGVEPEAVLKGVVAALAYDHPEDPSARKLADMIEREGVDHVLRNVCGLSEDDELFTRIRAAWQEGGN